jgi:hypothetical protein
MLFHGTFEEAKELAQQQSRWLIVNLQSTTQFGSHQLNRDTWRNDMVRSLVEENFVLFQAYDSVEDGQRLQQQYKLYDIPATLIVDPVTGGGAGGEGFWNSVAPLLCMRHAHCTLSSHGKEAGGSVRCLPLTGDSVDAAARWCGLEEALGGACGMGGLTGGDRGPPYQLSRAPPFSHARPRPACRLTHTRRAGAPMRQWTGFVDAER